MTKKSLSPDEMVAHLVKMLDEMVDEHHVKSTMQFLAQRIHQTINGDEDIDKGEAAFFLMIWHRDDVAAVSSVGNSTRKDTVTAIKTHLARMQGDNQSGSA